MKDKSDIIILIVGIFVTLGIITAIYFINKYEKDHEDAIKFSEEYTKVDKDNVFVYKTIDEIIEILENGTGIVYLGFPECPWCQAYVPILNDVAREKGIDKIYYFNISEDRKDNTVKYQKIVKLLSGNLLLNDEGKERIFVPDVTFVLSGEIVGHDNETSVVSEDDGTPEEYWTYDKVNSLKTKLGEMIDKIESTSCTDCNI